MKAICIYGSKFQSNVGILARSAYLYGYDAIYTIGSRYRRYKADTVNAAKHMPIEALQNFGELYDIAESMNAEVVFVEIGNSARHLSVYTHPTNAIYVLGAEDSGIPPNIICDHVMRGGHMVAIDTPRPYSLNVAVAGSIVMYDRGSKGLP